ncbi:MAG: hypothetical protein HC896_05050 [Bacteroidales bacterium]|nr:hypothetical protein [Bacteroidales bacterium]
MTQITLNIKDSRKLSFLLELLKNFDFVEVEKTSKVSLKEEIKEAVDQVNKIKQGKLKPKSFDEFINEL